MQCTPIDRMSVISCARTSLGLRCAAWLVPLGGLLAAPRLSPTARVAAIATIASDRKIRPMGFDPSRRGMARAYTRTSAPSPMRFRRVLPRNSPDTQR
jgi:hypothetical protein